MSQIDEALDTALRWHQAGQGAVLATVVETWGSAPRRVGAQLAVSGNGELHGSVSGGCVEGAVIVEAQEALERQECRLLEYGVSDEDAFAVGLACGGTIRVFLEPLGAGGLAVDMAAEMVAARATRQPVAYEVDIETGQRALVTRGHEERFARDRSGFAEDGSRFVLIHNPPLRLVIVGAVHIAQALVPMARIAGFDPFVIDPRDAFASAQRFADQEVIVAWPDEALTSLELDARTALVLLTHDPKLDDPALEIALGSDVFYIGALGSTRTHAKRLARFQAQGFSESALSRIHGPVGLDIGAANPAEIALAVMAQIVQVQRRGT